MFVFSKHPSIITIRHVRFSNLRWTCAWILQQHGHTATTLGAQISSMPSCNQCQPTHPNHAKQMCQALKKNTNSMTIALFQKKNDMSDMSKSLEFAVVTTFFWWKKIHLISVSSPKPCQHRLQALRDGLWNPTSDRRFVWARVFFGTNPGIEKSEYVYIYIYGTHMFICMCTYIPLHIYVYIYIIQLDSDVYMYIHIHIFICIQIHEPPLPELGVQVHMLLVGLFKAGLNWSDDFVQKWIVKLSFWYDKCRCFESIKPILKMSRPPTGQSLQIILNLMLLSPVQPQEISWFSSGSQL